MPGIVDDLVAPELARMVSHHLVVEQHHDALGMRATVSWNIHLKDVEVASDEIIGGPE